MKNKNHLLGVRFDNVDSKNIFFHMERFLNSKKFSMITPVNPEMLISAKDDSNFKEILNNSELNTPEATGILLGFKLKFVRLKKYPGSSMVYDVLKFCEENNKKIFFLGTKTEINKKAQENVLKKYPKIKIQGYSPPPYVNYPNKQFPKSEEDKIFYELNKFKPDIICAFWGAPFQETWFSNNKEKLQKLGVIIGISMGGTADFLSGHTKRAPKIFQRLNLEWLYRLTTEKGRTKRFFTRIPLFVVLCIKEAF
jgi:N-acetylglucosaminyldiphosphoundecaprenol N-acetyl-beta-D-mannosaminyltransferase